MKRRLTVVVLLGMLVVALGCSSGKPAAVAPAAAVSTSPAAQRKPTALPSPTTLPSPTALPPVVLPVADGSPLGVLSPTPNLLPSGTVSVTLTLATAVPASCRWSENAGTRYDVMSNDFEQGQDTTVHTTAVTGLRDLDSRYFYVRCRDAAGGRDPNASEVQTHLRVLGPWTSGYPRLTHLWGQAKPSRGASFYARYNLLIPYAWSGQASLADAIRQINPSAKLLLGLYGPKSLPARDALSAEWWDSKPGDAGYRCLLRDSTGRLVLRSGTDAVNNLTRPYCREALARWNVSQFLSSDPGWGDNLAYDGIYWDGLGGSISWLGNDIDSNLDGQPDDPKVLDAAYRAGALDFVAQVRASLPHALLLGNGSPPEYAASLNGRISETGLVEVQNGVEGRTWDAAVVKYRDWAQTGHQPRITTLFSAIEPVYRGKYDRESEPPILPAFEEEAIASYQRMRFGLVSALMGDGLFFYNLGGVAGPLAWYDEFGAPAGTQGATLPPEGYLGQPTGEPVRLPGLSDGGVSNVWARPFEHGLAVINASTEVETARLPGVYCKLPGTQAPLFQLRVDDDAAAVSGGWRSQEANERQFGGTVHAAPAGTAGTITYAPLLAYEGVYEVSTWVAPASTQSRTASVTIQHAQGETVVPLDETTGEPGWQSLGKYTFSSGETGRAVLSAAGSGEVVADAFKWVSTARYNDGSTVSEVALQPQDAIVLLQSCYKSSNQR